MNDKVVEDGVEYDVTYRQDKEWFYAKAIINGVPFEGCGREEQTALWRLRQRINEANFSLGVEPKN